MATSWKLVYDMKFTAIQKKLKDEYGIEVAMPTLYSWVSNEKKSLCTWWNPDKRFNPKQTSDLPKKWLVKSTRKTEYHQSSNARAMVQQFLTYVCCAKAVSNLKST